MHTQNYIHVFLYISYSELDNADAAEHARYFSVVWCKLSKKKVGKYFFFLDDSRT